MQRKAKSKIRTKGFNIRQPSGGDQVEVQLLNSKNPFNPKNPFKRTVQVQRDQVLVEEECKEEKIKVEKQSLWQQSKKVKEEEWVGMLSVRKEKILVDEKKIKAYVYVKNGAVTTKCFFNQED